jgi:hypothetical protein
MIVRWLRVVPFAVVVAAAVALAGCSSAQSGKGSVSSPAGQSAGSGASAGSGSTSAAPRDLKSQLLTVSELPTGWALDNSAANNTNDTTPPCLAAVKAKVEPAAKADQDFVKGTDFPALSQHIGDFGSSSAASSPFSDMTSTLDGCRDVSFTSEGTKITGSIGQMSFAKLGDRSEAWQMVLSAQGQTVGIDLVLVQRNRELELLLYGELGSPDVGQFTALASKAVAKLPS